jgi:hypothetical protein
MIRDEYSDEATLRQINELFSSIDYTGPDRDVILTIRAKASQIVLEEVSKPIYDRVDSLEYQPLHAVQQYYRISMRNPTAPAEHPVIEIRYPKQFSYFRSGKEPDVTYYKQTEGRNRMQFFLPETGSWCESIYLDAEDYASQGGHARMYEVNFTDLPEAIQMLEGDCE